MNKKIIQKVLDELQKEIPKLDYIRGILETLIDSEDEPKSYISRSALEPAGLPIINTIHPNLTSAEQAVLMAEQGFVKGTKPGVAESNIILK